jgi:hypothetical protein
MTIRSLALALALLSGCGSMDLSPEAMPSKAAEGGGNLDGQREPAAGTLTAGSFDDHLNPEAFDGFLAKKGGQVPLGLTRRATILVKDPAGAPLGNATVTVSASGNKLLTVLTGSDGRALFLPERDGAGSETRFSVTAAIGSASRSEAFSLDQPVWSLTMPGVTAKPPTLLDVGFLVDATGSMGDEMEYLKKEVAAIAAEIAAAHPTVDARFALVVYRDHGDEYVTRSFDFASLASFQSSLGQQEAGGGGDYEEAVPEGLEQARQLRWREQGAARVLFHIADAPPHEPVVGQTLEATSALRTQGIRLYPVAASGAAERAELLMRAGAFITQARYLFLTDDSGVGNAHAEPSVPCYQVEKLAGLIARMIRSELAGALLPADPAQVLRTVGNPVGGVCKPER